MRRPRKVRRPLLPDPEYGSVTLEKLINHVMLSGKKTTARSVVYDAVERIRKAEKGADPIALLETAILNVTPLVEVKSRRVGGATYQVPCEVRGERKTTLAMRWIIGAARGKKGKPMAVKLSDELLAASRKEGEAMKKRENVHKMAEANKAFAHFAW